MQIERIIIQNIGPFTDLDLDLSGNSVAFVGLNGSGKTLLLSSIVDFIYEHLRGVGLHDVMHEDGMSYNYFRITSPHFLKNPEQPGLIWITGKIDEHDLFYLEQYGYDTKEAVAHRLHLDDASVVPWPNNNASKAINSLDQEAKMDAQTHVRQIPILFLPSTRFENESWKTEKYFDADFSIARPSKNSLGHPVELYKSFRENYNWLINVVFNAVHFPRVAGVTDKLSVVNFILSKLLGTNAVINISQDYSDRLRIANESRTSLLVRSLSHLSLGQMAVLNIVLNILRESDQNVPIDSIQGLVVIDEIDAHLTGAYKTDVLPYIINLFPQVQFIVTTHDPLSVIGLERNSSIKLLELPSGNEILAKDFKEVETARKELRKQNRELQRIVKDIEQSGKPILLVEDEHSEIYKVAWLKLRKIDFDLNNMSQVFSNHSPFDIVSAKGHKNLYSFLNMDKFPTSIADKKVVGLFDFDEAFCSFNGLDSRTWSDIGGDDLTGLCRSHLVTSGYRALVLPVPYQRRGLARSAYGDKSRLSIELYFSNKCLGTHCVIDDKAPGKLVKFAGNKATFWQVCIHYERDEFRQFKKLFSKINTLLGL